MTPFKVGQKVVVVDDSNGYGNKEAVPNFKKGDIVKVESADSDMIGVSGDDRRWYYKRFAPIQSNYSDATAEILEKFKQTEETPDKILIPETIQN